MLPEQLVYLDYRQSAATGRAGAGRLRAAPLEDVYRFEPVPAELDEAEAAPGHRRAGQRLDRAHGHRATVDYMAFPRLCRLRRGGVERARAGFAGFDRRLRPLPGLEPRRGVPPADGPLPWQRRPGVTGRPVDPAAWQATLAGWTRNLRRTH